MSTIENLDLQTLEALLPQLCLNNCIIRSDAERTRIYRILVALIALFLEVDIEVTSNAIFSATNVTIV